MYLSHATYLKIAVEEAFRGSKAGGPMEGAALVLDGIVVGRGHRAAGTHAFSACMVAAGPLTVAELARAALYLSRAPCRACLETILSSGIPLMVLTCDGPLEESGGSTPERIHIPLEYDGEDGRWRLFAGGVCAVDADDNH